MSRQRATLSQKNKNWISKHRFYELKHYCLQYKDWEYEYNNLTGLKSQLYSTERTDKSFGDPTFSTAERCIFLKSQMDLIQTTAKDACGDLFSYIFKNVINDLPYNTTIPCCRNTYYKYYRRFFYLLNERKLRSR